MGLILNILIAIYIGLAMQPTPTVEETVVEEVAVVEETVAESEPETPAEAPHSPQKSVSEQKPASVPSTPLKPAQRQYTNWLDFERDYMGWCPKDVPEGLWPDALPAAAALGLSINMTLEESNTPRGDILSIWNTYRSTYYLGDIYRFATIERLGIKTEPDCPDGFYRINDHTLSTASGYWFELNWLTKTVYVTTDEDGHSTVSATALKQADEAAAWMTNYIRWLDNSYNAKCGS